MQTPANFVNLEDSILDYIAGNFDGDGHVIVGTNKQGLTIGLDKAEKSLNVLYWFQDHLGGSIHLKRPETETTQTNYVWLLHSPAAVQLADQLKNRACIKKLQLEVAATFPTELKVSVIARRGAEQRTFRSVFECSQSLNISYSRLYRLLPNPDSIAKRQPKQKRIKQIDGWSFERIDRTAIDYQNQCNFVDEQLRRLKTEPHPEIDKILSYPYLAGLFDAEGCVSSITGDAWKISLPQAHTEILNTIANQIGGAVFKSKKNEKQNAWQLYPKLGLEFLRNIEPYLIEKREQANLILYMTKGDGPDIKKKLRALKGNYTAKTKFI